MQNTILNQPDIKEASSTPSQPLSSTKHLPDYAVISVTPHSDYTLDLVFADGRQATFDFAPYLSKPYYAPLRNVALFMRAHIKYFTVVWTEEIDIAPDFLYSESST